MATVRKWVEIRARIPVDIKYGEHGLVYVTSPLLRGLLLAEKTEAEALSLLTKTVEDFGVAADEQHPVKP